MLNVFTCECLLEHLIQMTYDEIEERIMNYVMFSLINKRMMYIHTGLDVLFFCIDFAHIVLHFVNETLFCIKRSDVYDDTCLDFIDFNGINNCCKNCVCCLTDSLTKYLIRLSK